MWRLLFYFVLITLAALGFSWLADRPGTVEVNWQGKTYQTELMVVVVGLIVAIVAVMFTWWLIKTLIIAPGRLSRHMQLKNREKGLDAVSRGLIAVSAGDAALARKFANRAGRKLHSDSLAILLKAQAAQLSGDRNTARRLYEAMLESPETEVAGLRGLYLEARREKEVEAARQFAEKAVKRNPQLSWSTQALLEIQSRSGQWSEALKTLELARSNNKVDKKTANRQRAVLLTAQALELEDGDMDKALANALEAHRLAPDLVPAADVAGRILASQGNVRRAAKVLEATWDISPHPDLALTYAYARPGDSPRDRLMRVRQLADRTPHNMEGPIAMAQAAIESHEWKEARQALKWLLNERPTARVCTLMARIEGGEFGDKGRVREWLARAVRAPRDPAWTADGYVSEHWAPVSPITGKLDAFEWKVPVEELEHHDEELPFDEFIPLKAEETVPKEANEPEQGGAIVAVAEPAEVETASAQKPEIEAPATNDEVEPAVTAETEPQLAPAKEIKPVVSAPQKSSQKPLEARSPVKSKPAVETIDVIEAEPVEEPVVIEDRKRSSETPKILEQQRAEKRMVRDEPDIYIPPRLPDDPGPFNSDNSTDSDRLPNRFRQSS